MAAVPVSYTHLDVYKRQAGILCGLSLYAIGALLFVPAAGVASFTFFLFALFVIALGLGCLETAANSYSSALGSTETAETRLNLSQSFNGLGQFTGPLLGGLLFFGGDEAGGGGGLDAVRMTYVGIACAVSYTHLDVYKRQGLLFIGRESGETEWPDRERDFLRLVCAMLGFFFAGKAHCEQQSFHIGVLNAAMDQVKVCLLYTSRCV